MRIALEGRRRAAASALLLTMLMAAATTAHAAAPSGFSLQTARAESGAYYGCVLPDSGSNWCFAITTARDGVSEVRGITWSGQAVEEWTETVPSALAFVGDATTVQFESSVVGEVDLRVEVASEAGVHYTNEGCVAYPLGLSVATESGAAFTATHTTGSIAGAAVQSSWPCNFFGTGASHAVFRFSPFGSLVP